MTRTTTNLRQQMCIRHSSLAGITQRPVFPPHPTLCHPGLVLEFPRDKSLRHPRRPTLYLDLDLNHANLTDTTTTAWR